METTSHFLIQKSIVQEGVEYKANISSGLDEFESPELFSVGQSTHDDTRETERSKVGIMSLRVDGILPLPAYASYRESWNVTERGSFLVGLYIFGRNFYVINKFMGEKGTRCHKGMGDILASTMETFIGLKIISHGDYGKKKDRKGQRVEKGSHWVAT